MVVVTLTDCPPRLRGDLSKWLMEINTGVYVGQLNQRVRDALWKRICDNLPKGRATMVCSANNEQRMVFRVHNTTWKPVDFEGLTLMQRPLCTASNDTHVSEPSKAAIGQMLRRRQTANACREKKAGYVVVDIETTGLDCEKDEILELGAARVVDHQITETFSALLLLQRTLPAEIIALTGITPEMTAEMGMLPTQALEQFWTFVGQSPMVGHNIRFDCAFLKKASADADIPVPSVSLVDTLALARDEVEDVANYRLETLAAYFGIEAADRHRALADCITTFQLYEKLNEI